MSVGEEGNFTTIQRCMKTCEGLGSTLRIACSATIKEYRSTHVCLSTFADTVESQTQTELFSQCRHYLRELQMFKLSWN